MTLANTAALQCAPSSLSSFSESSCSSSALSSSAASSRAAASPDPTCRWKVWLRPRQPCRWSKSVPRQLRRRRQRTSNKRPPETDIARIKGYPIDECASLPEQGGVHPLCLFWHARELKNH